MKNQAEEIAALLLCNCGEPEKTLQWWIALMRWYVWVERSPGSPSNYEKRAAEFAALFPDPEHPSAWGVLYLLGNLGVIAHGGGVRGGWLTDEGKEVLARLESMKGEG